MIRSQFQLCMAAIGVLLSLCPLVRAGEMGTGGDVCGRAQQLIAGTSQIPVVETPADREAFVESKATDQPFVVQQFWSTHLPSGEGEPTVVSCKMRTAERIRTVQGAQTAAEDSSCDAIHREMLASALADVPAAEQRLGPEAWVVDEEDLTFAGPLWLDPWPFVPLARDEDGRLRIRSRALYVPHAWWIPMPERFQGNYYCHLIAPDYLRSLIRGEREPGV